MTASGGSAFGAGKVLAVNGQIVTNLVLASAEAYVVDSTLTTTGGDVSIQAATTSGIDATILSALSTGATGAAIVLAFNSIGWKPSNILFNAVDALLGDPLISSAFNGEQPAATSAALTNSTVAFAGGDVAVSRRRRRPAQRDGVERRELGRLGSLEGDRQERRRHPRQQQGLDRDDARPSRTRPSRPTATSP